MKRTLFACLIFALAMPALADDADNGPGYYRSTMPDGSVVFGDKPAKGASKSVFVPLNKKDQNIVAPPVPNDDGVTKRRVDENLQQRKQALDTAADELQQAQQQLADAQAALANGKEPQEGERSGTATMSCSTNKDGTRNCVPVPSGSTQLNDDYYARQKQLQDAVDAAQQRFNEAQQKYNDARY